MWESRLVWRHRARLTLGTLSRPKHVVHTVKGAAERVSAQAARESCILVVNSERAAF